MNSELDINKNLAKTKPDLAILGFKRLLKASRNSNYEYGVINSLMNIGILKMKNGHANEAFFIFKDLQGICKRSQSGSRYLGSVNNLIGITLDKMGKREDAMNYFFEALKESENNPQSTLSPEIIYNNIGNLFFNYIGDAEKVITYLNRAEASAIKTENYKVLGQILINKALYFKKTDNSKSAKLTLLSALKLGQKQNDTLLQYRVLIRLALSNLYDNSPQKRLEYFKIAENLLPNGENDMEQDIYYLRVRAELHRDLGEYGSAIQLFKQAIVLGKQHQLINQLERTYFSISEVYSTVGQYKDAYEARVVFQRLRDSAIRLEVQKDINELDTKYRSTAKDKEISEKKLLIAQQQKKIADKNKWVAISTSGAISLLVLGIGIFLNYRNRQRLQHKEMSLLAKENEINLLKGIIKGEEKERARLARELHDGIGGMLTSANLNLNRTIAAEEKEKSLHQLQYMIKDIASEVRRTAHNLMPDALIQHKLEEALLNYISTINSPEGLMVDLHIVGDLDLLKKPTELLLYRMGQELIQNVIKHARASYAVLQIVQKEQLISLSIEDDGVGFDTKGEQEGYGLQNLRYKVQALQGYISIQSETGKGTTIYIEFDINRLEEIN